MAAVKKGTPARRKSARRVPSRIARAARTAIADVLRVRKGERVVIVTNPFDDVLTISAALYDAALDRGADATVIIQPRRTSLDMASDAVIHALRSEPEVTISISADKLGKDRFGMEKPYRFGRGRGSWTHIFNALMATGRSRSFWSPSVTLDMFARTVPVDYARMRRQAAKLKRALDRADRVLITAPGGTDIEIGLRDRKGRADDGAFWKPGSGGNLPAGETYISPTNYDADGVLVFDGSLATADGGGAFVPRAPVTVDVSGGLVTAVRGGAGARRFERSLRLGEEAAQKMRGRTGWTARRIATYARNARHLGELGIGLNPAARVTGNMLEDEKILGTCHIAIGANYDEDAQAFTHLDCIVKSPTITTIGRNGRRAALMKSGKIC
ncbi:MAG: peptidase M17 [Candidatus Eisenbacteria sp.]|nr:peptidase M17 [Candidatus Eisenbacteria bacterium]